VGANLSFMRTPRPDLPPRSIDPLRVAALALVLLLAPAIAACAEETKPADPNGKPAPAASKAASPVKKVFTNKDLERYHSASAGGAIVVDMNAVQQKKDEAAPPKDEGAIYPDEKARRMADLEQQIKDVQERVADLDKRLAFMANPYLPPPQMTPEEIQAQKGTSQKEAYQALQAEKAALVERASGLQGDLARLIATPTQPRAGADATPPDSGSQPQP
jgi:hypothetical protein